MRVPVFRISLTNAALLSGAYLAVGAAVEVVRREWSPRWADRLSLALEAFPARMLHFMGVFEPMRDAFVAGRLSVTQVRLAYAVTTVTLIFLLGLAVGGLMWGFARLKLRRAADE